jgi:Flp pilus assembly pilin Flp
VVFVAEIGRNRGQRVTPHLGAILSAAWLLALLAMMWVYRPRRRKRDLLAPPPSLGGFAKGESGATAIEYALILVLVSLSCFAVLEDVATGLNGLFNRVSDKFDSLH